MVCGVCGRRRPALSLGATIKLLHAARFLTLGCSYMVLIYRNGDTETTYTRTVSGTTHTERGPGDAGLQWGMYTVKVAAVSANGASSDPAKAGPLTVGKPSKPAAAPTATGGIGNLTLDWQKPAEDPDPANTVFYAKVGRCSWPPEQQLL